MKLRGEANELEDTDAEDWLRLSLLTPPYVHLILSFE